MDYQPARRLSGLLSRIDHDLADPATRPLDRFAGRSAASDSLIVAFIGPSGVGKSELINRLAGERVVASGPLRPTTTGVAVWGDVSPSYLGGSRIGGPSPPAGVALVDTPAAEHYPDAIGGVLDRVDAAILVTSPDRYADAVVAIAGAAIAERGVPTRTVLSVDRRAIVDVEAVADDAATKIGVAIDAVVIDDVAPLSNLLESMSGNRQAIMERRDRGAAIFAAGRALEVADLFASRSVGADRAVSRMVERFDRLTFDRGRLAAAARKDWDAARREIVELCRVATDGVIEDAAADIAGDGVAEEMLASVLADVPAIDRQPIDEWHRASADRATRAVKHRHIHPRRRRVARDDVWRLSADFERRPSSQMRRALGERLPEVRYDSGMALMDAMAGASDRRRSAVISGLDPFVDVSPGEIRSAARELGEAGSGDWGIVDE